MKKIEVENLLRDAWQARGQEHYQRARQLAYKAEDQCGLQDHMYLGRVYHILMQVEYDLGNLRQALQWNRQSLYHYRQLGDLSHIAHSLRHKADLQRHLSHKADSEASYLTVIDLYTHNPGTLPLDLANTRRGFALLLEDLGRNKEALQQWKQALAIYQSAGVGEGVKEANFHITTLKDDL